MEQKINSKNNKNRIEIHGHRGARAIYPENTISSFEYIFQNRIQFVELDVHLTKDHQVVVFHDFEVKYHNQILAIKELTLEELQSINIGPIKNKKTGFPQNTLEREQVPTLKEVLQLRKKYKDLDIHWDVEIKYDEKLSVSKNKLVEHVLVVISQEQLISSCTLFSFDIGILKLVRKLAPNLKINFLYEGEPLLPKNISGLLGFVFKKQVQFYCPSWGKVKRIIGEIKPEVFAPHYKLVRSLNSKGEKLLDKRNRQFKLLVWTANKESEWDWLIEKSQVDGIITDDPVRLKEKI